MGAVVSQRNHHTDNGVNQDVEVNVISHAKRQRDSEAPSRTVLSRRRCGVIGVASALAPRDRERNSTGIAKLRGACE